MILPLKYHIHYKNQGFGEFFSTLEQLKAKQPEIATEQVPINRNNIYTCKKDSKIIAYNNSGSMDHSPCLLG